MVRDDAKQLDFVQSVIPRGNFKDPISKPILLLAVQLYYLFNKPIF